MMLSSLMEEETRFTCVFTYVFASFLRWFIHKENVEIQIDIIIAQDMVDCG